MSEPQRAWDQREGNHGRLWKRRAGGWRHHVCYIHLVPRPQAMRQDAGGGLQVGPRPQMRLWVFCIRLEERTRGAYPITRSPRRAIHFSPAARWYLRAPPQCLCSPRGPLPLHLPLPTIPPPSVPHSLQSSPLLLSLLHPISFFSTPFSCFPYPFLPCLPFSLSPLRPLSPDPYWGHWQVFFSLRSLLI